MRSSSFVAVALCTLISTVYSAPTPQLSNIIGSIFNPSARNNNKFKGIANSNGNGNGNHNQTGNENEAGSQTKITFLSPSDLGIRRHDAGTLDPVTQMLSSISNRLASLDNPTSASDNSFKGIENGNANSNGNGNSAGNGNGNGNSAGNGNTISLPDVHFPDVDFSPVINSA